MAVATALPLVPAASCPSPAGVLATAGLGPICQAASGAVGQAASSVVGFGASSVLDAMGSWVSGGAVWLLQQIGAVLSATTSIDLGASWFTTHYETMAALAGVVVLPLLLLGIVQSIYRQSASMLVRSVVLNVPLALLLTAIAVKLVQIGLSVTDDMSAAVARGAGLDSGNFMASVATDLDDGSGSGTPAFVLFLGGIVVVIGAVLVWIELLVRSAAVYVAVLFLPLALASLAWPAIAHWCRRLVDTLAALVLGKFVIVSVLSLAAGALAGGSAPGGDSQSGGGFAAVLGGAALLLLAAFAPWALFRLLPFVEAGAVGHLEGLGRRAGHQAATPVRGLAAGCDACGRGQVDGFGRDCRAGPPGCGRPRERGRRTSGHTARGSVFGRHDRCREHLPAGSGHPTVGAPSGRHRRRPPHPARPRARPARAEAGPLAFRDRRLDLAPGAGTRGPPGSAPEADRRAHRRFPRPRSARREARRAVAPARRWLCGRS